MPKITSSDLSLAELVCTPRELEALRPYADGYGLNRIARLLGVTRSTARVLVANGLARVAEAADAAKALRTTI